MEPTLHSGALLMIEPVDTQNVQVGDIIVYNVPTMVREYYGYPAVVAHRVIEVRTSPTLGYRTKGDNTGEDPLTVRPSDIRGTVGQQIPYAGLPFLFFQSQQGIIFIVVGLALLAFFLYGGEISRGGNFLHRSIFAPVIKEEKRSARVLEKKIETTEQRMTSTEQALEKFAAAIELYAQHLASHTSAIQGLAAASHELKNSAAEQNRVLVHLMEVAKMTEASKEAASLPTPKAEEPKDITSPEPSAHKPAPPVSKPTSMTVRPIHVTVKSISSGTKPAPQEAKPVKAEEKPAMEKTSGEYPPGCAITNRRAKKQDQHTETA